ncbi:MAG: sugar ABC transporter ATP-binding protein [Verrucomicrobia bacterium]|nr:sugar ABC transporter ATP-binding protein [Verrucomicrobiota bacterium]MBV8481884.1 sugar ABC transporter ATP-binding protein [Verrucomicrobiota bacterium]
MSEANLLLEARDVAKRFDSVVALKAASLQVRAGEVHGLMGANGAGKSTLVKIITGVFPADGGLIFVKGAARSFRSPAEARRAGIVSVYQDPALVPDLTVTQNMGLASAPVDAVRKWLAELGVARLDFSLLVRDLPDPTLRLIDLARALAWEPAVLLLDEITASLPADLSEQIYAMVKRWRERGNAVIFISHRMAEVSALCDRATVLRDGVTAGVTERAHGSEERIVSLMLGAETARAVASAPSTRTPLQRAADAKPALEIRALRCAPRVNDVSFKLYPGEVLGIAALEGQGQEELFDCIAGSRRYDEGAVLAYGKELRLRHPADAIAAGIVLVPANRLLALLQQRPIPENIALPAFGRVQNWGPISISEERKRVASAIERLQIDTRAGSELRRLSGGNQQKVVIARWLASGFDILLCFDPTRGIDIGTKRQIYALVREIAAAGSAVLLFTSELPEIPLACDRAIVLFGGRVVAEMPVSEADEATLLRSAHGLAPSVAGSP